MSRVFENELDLKNLNENLHQTLLEAHRDFDTIIASETNEDTKKRLMNLESKVDTVTKSLKKINQLILLNFYQGNKWRKIEVSTPLKASIDKLKRHADKKEQKIDFENQTTAAINYGDGIIFEEFIFDNLISNAIKFSPHGSTIHIRLSQTADYNIIEIRDYGIGMDADQLYRINSLTDRIYTADTDGQIGSGMSFPIVSSLMRKLNGSLIVNSWTKESAEHKRGTAVKLKFHRF
ncbi:sensor histidine kinase KdpD [Bacteriovorax sp. Seq25_V]|uniref:sensor histidine kinase n=1 Tax=Bacteriovorax sp. Seq25_V TaxID=1201288 RepID=UPI000389F070|nr:sensor histidine kinase [Bacteriovorax sp. Seq25_V]EQC43715.1 GHKL domain protein [Bacteriovorax sp. Seq25_V]